MNLLLSVNYKMFLNYDSSTLIKRIKSLDKSGLVKGIELYINLDSDIEKNYGIELAKLLKDENLILQLHSVNMDGFSENKILECMEYYNKIANLYDDVIKLTIHPYATKEGEIEATQNTIQILKIIKKYIDDNNSKIDIMIENLNKYNEVPRGNLDYVSNILTKIDEVYFTFDIGHYVYDYSNDYVGKELEIRNKLKNIHICDIDNSGHDHYPFYYNNVKLDVIAEYLKLVKYNENVVVEIAMDYLNGGDIDGKLAEYIKELEKIDKCLKTHKI